jgi:hypothetical protein
MASGDIERHTRWLRGLPEALPSRQICEFCDSLVAIEAAEPGRADGLVAIEAAKPGHAIGAQARRKFGNGRNSFVEIADHGTNRN